MVLKDNYPDTICNDCGRIHGHWPEGHVASVYKGRCGWCGRETVVTQARDYGYPSWPVEKEKER